MINKEILDKILRVEVFVNKDGRLRVAHLILGYTLILSSFQAPKCIINAKDPRLHRISVAVPSFLLPEGTPIPEGTLITQPIPEGVPKVDFPLQRTIGEATSSQPINKKGDEEEEEKEKEIVDISNSEDLYEVFDHPWSPETTSLPNEIGI